MSHEASKVSIVLPIYNVEAWLDDCLLSLRAQSYRDFEIVVVNDGSKDSSRDIAQRHRALDPRMRIVDQENRGLGGARNTGIEHATGEFLIFVDSDDFVAEAFVERLVTAQEATGAEVVSCSHAKVNEQSLFLEFAKSAAVQGDDVAALSDYERVLGVYTTSVAWGRLFRTTKLLRSGLRFFEHVPHEDLFYTYKILRGSTHAMVDEPLYFWRQRKGSLGNGLTQAHLEIPWRLRKDAEDYLDANNASPEERTLSARRNLIFLNSLWSRALSDGNALLPALLADIQSHRREIDDDMCLVQNQFADRKSQHSGAIRSLAKRLAAQFD